MSSRRRFLQSSAALALSQVPWLSTSCSTRPTGPDDLGVSPEAWKELKDHLKGPLLRQGDPNFNSIAAPWNLRYANVRKPAGIARCVDPADIKTSLQWAQANKVPFVTRSGGHSYAGYSTTPGLMIDVSLQNSISFDKNTGLATVGGGARNATLYDALPPTGTSVTHGRCKEVGVGGLVLGGGIGFNMRLHGLLIDQLKETTILLADGSTRRCNALENSRLLWACKGGGGGNFGINTSFTFQTFPVDQVTVFNLYWTENLDALLPAALDLLPGTPDRLGAKLSVVNKAGDPLKINILGQLVGSPEEVRQLFAPLFRLSAPSSQTIKTMDYWTAQKEFLGEDGAKEYSHERSHYGFKPMSAAGCRTILQNMRAWPGTSALTTWKMFLVGGAVSRVAPTATAYWHRNATMCTTVELNWTAKDNKLNVERNEIWLNRFHQEMVQYTSDQSYQNFIDNSQKNYLRAYYGDNLEGLIAVKNDVDPGNVFHYPQSIPLKLPS